MNKTWLCGAAALALASMASVPANAITTVNGVLGASSFGTVPGAASGSFTNPDVIGAFSDVFTFNVTQAGYLSSTSGTSIGNNDFNDIEGFTLTLTGPGGFVPVSASDIFGGVGFVSFAALTNVLLTQLGSYSLTVSGLAGTLGSSYGGSFSFSSADAPNAVPLPGALVLMGTVLAGGAGFGAMRKRAKKAAGLQTA